MNIKESITGLIRRNKKSELGNAIMDLLSKEGFRPEWKDDFIVFRVEGTVLYFSFDDKDKHFARLVLPNFYEVTGENKVLALYNMNYMNMRYKFSYIFLEDDRISAALDMLYYTENLKPDVFRMMGIIWDTRSDFSKEMAKGYSCN